MSDHDNFSTAGASVDFKDMAKQMCRSSGEGADAFSAQSNKFSKMRGGLMSLLPQDEEKDESDHEQDEDLSADEVPAEGAGKGTEQASGSKKKGGKAQSSKYFDREAAVVKAKRWVRDNLKDLNEKLENTLKEADAELAIIAQLGAEASETLQDEKKILINRKLAITKVLGDETDLRAYVSSFDVAMGTPTKVGIGDAPPCRQYADLVSVDWLQTKALELDSADTKEDMESIKKDITLKKKPAMTLVAAVHGATADLIRAHKALETSAKKRDATKTAEPSTKKSKTDVDLFDAAGDVARQMDYVASADDLKSLQPGSDPWRLPTLVGKDAVKEFLATAMTESDGALDHEIKAGQRSLKEQLKTLPKGAAHLRGAFSLQPSFHPSALKLLKNIFPFETVMPGANEKLAAVLEPQVFAMSPGNIFSQAEKGHFGCVRVHTEGTKTILTTPEENLLAFMVSRAPGTHPSFSDLWQFFKTMSKDVMQAYAAGQGKDKLFHCTVSAGDVLFTPPCFVLAERAMAGSCSGLKFTVICSAHGKELDKIYKELNKRNRHANPTGDLIKAAIDAARAQTTIEDNAQKLAALENLPTAVDAKEKAAADTAAAADAADAEMRAAAEAADAAPDDEAKAKAGAAAAEAACAAKVAAKEAKAAAEAAAKKKAAAKDNA